MKLSGLREHRNFILFGIISLVLPLLFRDSLSALIIISNIAIMGAFAMSYDLLLGYTGIVSLGHAVFFGLGAYSVGIFMKKMDHTWLYLLAAVLTAIILTALVSLIIGVLTLRLKRYFFAMLTVVLAESFMILGERWRALTNGSDGFTFQVPDFLNDKLVYSYLAVLFLIVVYLALRRFTLSPLGRVLKAIRDNEKRVEALGYNMFYYKLISNVVAGVVAGLAGVVYAIGMKYINVPSVLGIEIALDALIITIIGGVGTLSGAIVGSGVVEIVRVMLEKLAKVHPVFERWMVLFGIIYILIIMFFPQGIVGFITQIREKQLKQARPKIEKHCQSDRSTGIF